jgi:UDP-N-acetylmuramoyl-tripeptide--D-alanyl-D-alanine ligase
MTALWTWDALVAAAAAQPDGMPTAAITGFSIDTRSIQSGEIFVALTDTRDGHDFVTAAFKAGAAAALVAHTYQPKPGDGPLLRVDDPLRALERIGIAARARLAPDARVIAITGSAGKTGTKDMLRACLLPFGKTHAPVKSFNNHWGVPLTLARMPVDTQYAVIEIGMNHAGEIAPLTRMTRPHVAIITNVLPVHIGNFPDGEIGVANAKGEIFAGLEADGTAIIPRDSVHYDRLRALPDKMGATVVTFGSDDRASLRALKIDPNASESHITVAVGSALIEYTLGARGRHLAENSLTVVAVLQMLDLPLPQALTPLARIAAPAGRGASTVLRLPLGPMLLIDESYNANPASMRAALANLALVPRDKYPRRVVVLGDMRELGADAPRHHRELKDAVIASGADLIFACGEHMQHLTAILDQGRVCWESTSAMLAPKVAATLRAGDVVMIKGSLGTNMAPIVATVLGLDATAQATKP